MATITWNAGNGTWDTAGDWNPTDVPTYADTAVISNGSTVTVNGESDAVGGLSITSGSLSIT